MLRTGDCTAHPLWHPPLPERIAWVRCKGCSHVYSDHYWTDEGFKELFRKANAHQVVGGATDQYRQLWSMLIDKVVAHLQRAPWGGISWLDAGCGNGGLAMAAAEYGFDAAGFDTRLTAVESLLGLGYRAKKVAFDQYAGDPVDVLSMMDLLEHLPQPVESLQKAHGMLKDAGILVISTPNMDCSSWRSMADANPYWGEIEHLHIFSRCGLFGLLEKSGFQPIQYSVGLHYKACMEVIARKN